MAILKLIRAYPGKISVFKKNAGVASYDVIQVVGGILWMKKTKFSPGDLFTGYYIDQLWDILVIVLAKV